jgi:hypothetical protein
MLSDWLTSKSKSHAPRSSNVKSRDIGIAIFGVAVHVSVSVFIIPFAGSPSGNEVTADYKTWKGCPLSHTSSWATLTYCTDLSVPVRFGGANLRPT